MHQLTGTRQKTKGNPPGKKLTQELAIALEVASKVQAWGNPSPFQDKINELLVRAGRKPVVANKAYTRRAKVEVQKVSSKSKVNRKGENN